MDSENACTCAAQDMPFGRCCKASDCGAKEPSMTDDLRAVMRYEEERMGPVSACIMRQVIARLDDAPLAIMDTRDVLGICAPEESDFPALYALQGKRVRLVVVEDYADAIRARSEQAREVWER